MIKFSDLTEFGQTVVSIIGLIILAALALGFQ